MQDKFVVTTSIASYEWIPYCNICGYMPTAGDVLILKDGKLRCKKCGWGFSYGNSKHIIQNSVPFAEVENQDYPERDYS